MLDDEYYFGKPKKQKRRIPFEFIREQAKASSEGGRAQCYFCKESFSMTYMRYCKVSSFRNEHVCCDCKRSHNCPAV